jgi:D-ribose pyranase
MKDRGLLHPELSRVVASMGHGDLLCIADAGLPVPPGVERIDLAFAPGLPRLLDVVSAVLGELGVQAYVLSEELQESKPSFVSALAQALPAAEALWVTHEQFKQETARARAIVRTGEFTPYANVLLRSGVGFGRQ